VNEHTEDDRIRLLLVDGQALFRASLGAFLKSQPGLEVAGDCGTSTEALEILRAFLVDVVLLEFEFQTDRGEDLITSARDAGFPGRFLIVAASADKKDSAAALRLGASGVFLKSEGADRLVQAIRLVANGAVWLDQSMIQLLTDPHTQFADLKSGNLTDREQKVLLGILGGLTNRQIGNNIGFSEGSVKAVVQQLFDKAGVRSRSQLVRVALEGSLGATREFRA
jgi:DNA-binding NarL/FixJ family response regulator